MNRRGLLKSIVAAILGVPVAALAKSAIDKKPEWPHVFTMFGAPLLAIGKNIEPAPKIEGSPDRFMYRGYKIRWTGWKGCQQSDDLYGQWVAFGHQSKNDGDWAGYYANSGGTSAVMYRGEAFNITCLSQRNWVTRSNVSEIGPRVRKDTLDNLMNLIHRLGHSWDLRPL